MSANRPLNINLYISNGIDDDEAERLAAILSEALDAHGFPRVLPEPEPVPQWRRLVNEQASTTNGDEPLSNVLYHLQQLSVRQRAKYHLEKEVDSLARIVAVCEQQVGDGWQADPDVEVVGSAWVLMTMFTDHDPRYEIGLAPAAARWMNLGNYAAAWLRDITEATS